MRKKSSEAIVRDKLVLNCVNLMTWPSGAVYKNKIQWMIDELRNPDTSLKDTLKLIGERHQATRKHPDDEDTCYAEILKRVPVMWTEDKKR